jgi:hypothetical protein
MEQYHLIHSYFNQENNRFIQTVILTDTKERCLIALDTYTEASEDNKVFLVNEEVINGVLIREFATVKRGYVRSLILVNANQVISSLQLIKKQLR